MICRTTHTLGDKINEKPSEQLPIAENPYADWAAHLFMGPYAEYIIVANTVSLYSFLIRAGDIRDEEAFIERLLPTLRNFLILDGYERFYREWVSVDTDEISFSTVQDREFKDEIHRLVNEAKVSLKESGLSPYQVSCHLNDMALSYLDDRCPKEAFRDLVDSVDRDSFSGV